MRTLMFLIIALQIVACSNNNKIEINDSCKSFLPFQNEKKIFFKNLMEFNGNPIETIISDSTLILADFTNGQKYYLHNYSLNKKKFSKPYLACGRGPGEIINLGSIGIYDNYLWLTDFAKKKNNFTQ